VLKVAYLLSLVRVEMEAVAKTLVGKEVESGGHPAVQRGDWY